MKYFNLFYCFVMVCVLQWTSMVNAKAVNNEANEIKLKFPQKKDGNKTYVNFNKHGALLMNTRALRNDGSGYYASYPIDYCHYNYSRGFVKCTFKGIRGDTHTLKNTYPELKVKLFVSGKKTKNCNINKNTKITKVDTNLSRNRAGYYELVNDEFSSKEFYINKLTLNANNGCTITLNIDSFQMGYEK